MKKFSHIYLIGCSYMNSYAATNPNLQLSQHFGGEIVDLTKAGTGFDYHYRMLSNRLFQDKPEKAIIVWGLSFWHRFELPYRNKIDKTINYLQFNPGSIVDNDMVQTFGEYHKDIKELPDYFLKHRITISDSYIENQLRQLIHLSAWLRNNNHEYIIFNYADDSYQKFLKKNMHYADKFVNDNGFIELEKFRMNIWLFDNNVKPEPKDIKLVPLYACHPVVDYYEEKLQ